MAPQMKGKVAMITGSARGIGEAMARLFSSNGAAVALADVDLNRAAKVAQEITESGGEAIAVKLNVASRKDVEAMIGETVKTHGRIDILINNAAINYSTPVEEVTDEDWDSILAVNVKGVYNCSRSVISTMNRNNWGRIINISSSAGKMGGPVSSIHYSASKAAVICMTKSFARHLASTTITVNSIAPGAVATDMAKLLSEEARQRAIEAIPLRRFAHPSEIAHVAMFLCSEEASYITGEILDVNGGTVMD